MHPSEPTPQEGAEESGVEGVTEFTEPDELVMGQRWDTFYRRIRYLASELCTHAKPGEKDSYGHSLYPCSKCMKFVRYVTEMWVEYIIGESDLAEQKMAKADCTVLLTHSSAFVVAAAVLDPEKSVAWPDYGAL